MQRLQPQRSHTAPTRSRKHRAARSDSPTKFQATNTPNFRPASDKRPNAARRSTTEPRRPSVGSSSEQSTTRSRHRERDSKPSSRRTSCTLVDPSRPARHYRIKSSQNVPTGDIDDVLALHFRSCSLFENPSYYSPLPSPAYAVRSGVASARASADIGPRHGNPVSGLRDNQSADYFNIANPKIRVLTAGDGKECEDMISTAQTANPNTTMHWISPSTRKRQYEKIDKANSGLRGFVSKIVPRCVSGPPPPKFYEKDQSDTGSVRRYRISNDQEDGDEERDMEKSASTLRPPRQTPRRTVSSTTTMSAKTRVKWGCF
jgi:hypothetical protein